MVEQKVFVENHEQLDAFREALYRDEKSYPDGGIWKALKEYENVSNPIFEKCQDWIRRRHHNLISECQIAINAINRGGAQLLDRGKATGSKSESVNLLVLIRNAEELSHTGIGFVLNKQLDDLPSHIQACLILSAKIKDVRDHLVAMLDLGSVGIAHNSKVAEDSVVDDGFRNAAWFSRVTGGDLNAGKLRKAVFDKRLLNSQKRGNRHFHSILEVCKSYPECSTRIMKAIEEEEKRGE